MPKPDPAAGRFITVVTFLLIFIMAARTAVDTDMWWHLRAGEETWSAGQPYLVDTLSYTRAGQAWINHSWLSQVGMYLLYSWKGSLALSLAMALLAVGSMALVYRQMDGPALFRLPLMILGAAVAALVWTPRPQMTSLFLMTLIGYLLYLFKWKRRRILFWLPPIFLLWSNLHGGYPLGLMLIGLLAAGEVLNHLVGSRDPEVLGWREIFHLLIWTAVSVMALLINPNGLDTWRIPFQTVGVEVLQKYIEEWASPDFHQRAQQPFLLLLFAAVAAAGLSRKRMDCSDLLTMIWFTAMALVARRNYGPFAVAVLPVTARLVWGVIQDWQAGSVNIRFYQTFKNVQARLQQLNARQAGAGVRRAINLAAAGLLGLAACLTIWGTNHPLIVEPKMGRDYPMATLEWIRQNKPAGRIFSEYRWGGYFSFALRDYPVFVDGRTDLYGDEILNQWIKVVRADPQWLEILDSWDVKMVLVDRSWPLANLLAYTKEWKPLFEEENALLYGR
jgi:hypothetical protein